MIDRKIFSVRLRLLRKRDNVTIVDVANALELSKQSINHFETERNLPSADKLAELADFFDVSIDYLVGRSESPEKLP